MCFRPLAEGVLLRLQSGGEGPSGNPDDQSEQYDDAKQQDYVEHDRARYNSHLRPALTSSLASRSAGSRPARQLSGAALRRLLLDRPDQRSTRNEHEDDSD